MIRHSIIARVLLPLLLLLSVGCTGEMLGSPADATVDAGALPADSSGDDAGDAPRDASDMGIADGSVPPDSSSGACDRGPTSWDDVIVRLEPRDDFQAANDENPPGTVFGVTAGVHTGQRVEGPKDGNQWIGEEGAIMDGEGSLSDAFSGSANGVVIRALEIRDYVDNGIFFDGGTGVVVDGVSVFDTGSGDGEGNGAVRFDNASNVTVTNCYFERVSSGVLPTNCTGPIVIEHNAGLNTGRNFVQLARVTGGGVRVRYNSMDRDGTYVRPGNDDVEDWISVFAVQGLVDDYVQISNNRARGHGPSDSGSFIMLGDGGGVYQEAVGNVGVTPGQVGVGLSGGHHIEARDNVMYSDSWDASNIAFYSADYGSGGCGDHVVTGNSASWTNAAGDQNGFWTAGDCTPLTESENTFPDLTMEASVWDSWPWSC